MIFNNIVGLLALLALVPFILIYLIKPKPTDKVIPSLMFLMKQQQAVKQNAFLRKLLRNTLFFLQLTALSALALSIAAPFIVIPYSVASDHSIIILDSSASMQTEFDSKTRFIKAIDTAKNSLSGKVSIIAAENMPFTLLRAGDAFQAKIILSKLNPKATSTNLGDAMLLADDILKAKKGRVIVLSDFIQTQGSDIFVAKRALDSKGNRIDFIEITSRAKNIGIIDLEITKQNTKAYIKNFNNREETFKVKLVKDNTVIAEKEITMLPNSLESLVFETQTGISSIQLDINDDLAMDNIAYISAPSKKQIEVLLITNKQKSSLMAALQASQDIKLSISHPPLSHMVDGRQINYKDFDVIIMAYVGKEGEREGLLKGHFKDMDDYLKANGKLVIAAQSDLAGVPTTQLSKNIFLEIMPVALTTMGNRTKVCFKTFNRFTSQFEENNCPAVVSEYLAATPKEDSVVIATSNDDSPLIAYKENVFYYGIIDDKSDFRTLSSYPIFWNKLINFLVRAEDINDYNFKGGDIIAIKEQNVITPTSTLTTSKLVLDEHGIYEFDNKKVAVNVLNEKESDVDKKSSITEQDIRFNPGRETKKKKFDLEIYLIALVLIIVLVEIVYIKKRGDL